MHNNTVGIPTITTTRVDTAKRLLCISISRRQRVAFRNSYITETLWFFFSGGRNFKFSAAGKKYLPAASAAAAAAAYFQVIAVSCSRQKYVG